MTPSDHAARAPSEAAVNSARDWMLSREASAMSLARRLDAFARAARKQALEDADRAVDAEMKLAQHCDHKGVYSLGIIKKRLASLLAQEPAP